jgi:prophage antirepressor-like protein
MVTVNGKESPVELDTRYMGQTEVNVIADEGAYTIASFSRRSDAEAFAELIKTEGRNYKTDKYRVV